MRPFPARSANRLIVWCAMFAALTACTNEHRWLAIPPLSSAPAAVHASWRPLHKGHADLSTGVYVREDDDLVVNTPFPIVLRRTYNSADGHPRQFGAETTHPGEWWIYGKSD